MSKRLPAKWFVQEDQLNKGPFTAQELQALMNQKKILGQSPVTGGPPGNSAKTVNDVIQLLSDPVYSLYGALQFAHHLTESLIHSDPTLPPSLQRRRSRVGLLLWVGGLLLVILGSLIAYWEKNNYENVNPFAPPQGNASPSFFTPHARSIPPEKASLPAPQPRDLAPETPAASANSQNTSSDSTDLRDSRDSPETKTDDRDTNLSSTEPNNNSDLASDNPENQDPDQPLVSLENLRKSTPPRQPSNTAEGYEDEQQMPQDSPNPNDSPPDPTPPLAAPSE